MDLAVRLEDIASSDERAARAAFDDLCRATRSRHLAIVRSLPIGHAEDADDVLQEALQRAWSARRRFRAQGVAAWNRWIVRIAGNVVFDRLRAEPEERAVPLDCVAETEVVVERDLVQDLIDDEERIGVFAAANATLLELDGSLSTETHTRQLIAAQLFYLDGLQWRDVIDCLAGSAPPREPELTRAELDLWLGHTGVLRLLGFSRLYLSGDELATLILQLGEDPDGLDSLTRGLQSWPPDAPSTYGMTWAEARIAVYRYRYGLSAEAIGRIAGIECGADVVARLDSALADRMPFAESMRELLNALKRSPGAVKQARFDAPGLWQRLAFEYRYLDDLALSDILKRIEPPSAIGGYAVTDGALNAWLSQRRLLERLREYVRKDFENRRRQTAY